MRLAQAYSVWNNIKKSTLHDLVRILELFYEQSFAKLLYIH